jgi:uncharacterized membrane-anchored protein
MTMRRRATLVTVVLIAVLGGLVLVFPRAYAFVELAARELRYLWWLVLIVALALWLFFGVRGKSDK